MADEKTYSQIIAEASGNRVFERIRQAPDSHAERMRQMYIEGRDSPAHADWD